MCADSCIGFSALLSGLQPNPGVRASRGTTPLTGSTWGDCSFNSSSRKHYSCSCLSSQPPYQVSLSIYPIRAEVWDSGSQTYRRRRGQCPASPQTGIMRVVVMVTCTCWRWRGWFPCPAGPATLWGPAASPARQQGPGGKGSCWGVALRDFVTGAPHTRQKSGDPCKSTLAQEESKKSLKACRKFC